MAAGGRRANRLLALRDGRTQAAFRESNLVLALVICIFYRFVPVTGLLCALWVSRFTDIFLGPPYFDLKILLLPLKKHVALGPFVYGDEADFKKELGTL